MAEEEGTGICPPSPAFGEEDYILPKKGIPLVNNLDDRGLYTDGPWQGQLVWDVNKEIAKTMLADGASGA